MTASINRRNFLRGSSALAASTLAVQALGANAARAAQGAPPRTANSASGAYGPLTPKAPLAAYTSYPGADTLEWLALPEGFEYVVFGITGDIMTDGNPTPIAHDGMAAFDMGGGRIRLVRNHEARDAIENVAAPIGANPYNPTAGGGTTTLELDTNGAMPTLTSHWVSLSGTHVNCAGGLTPSGSWISSEETVDFRGGVRHGYNFEVPASANGPVVPVALTDMGRFAHEAVAVDPSTGIVYETEDAGDSGFYRFVPNDPANLAAGGTLEMLAVKGSPNFNTKTGQKMNKAMPVAWVPIADPDPDVDELDRKAIYDQGIAEGGAIFGRLEGCWWGNGAVYFNCTNGGDAGVGQIWEYKPAGNSAGFLKLVYESPSGDVLASPDNICLSPRGGLLVCEDHGFDRPLDPFAPLPWATPGDDDQVEVQYMKGLTRDGRIFDFAANILDDKEWAGACFSPDGSFLFANTQGTTRNYDPNRPDNRGRTYAIWGPWERGAL